MKLSTEIKELIEAALFASGRSMSIEELAKICGSGNLGVVRRCADELVNEYRERKSGIEIQKDGSSYIMKVRNDLEGCVIHLIPETEIPAPILKTLALIAYEQPIKQSDLARERGNRIYEYVRFLVKMGLVERKRCGRTRILTVTPKFREYFQIKDMDEFIERYVRVDEEKGDEEDTKDK
ncbi:MAG: SMC-Scp complex subunit ScpB [Candidatus Altiarchaeales archaeon]|nr:MAG: SMC-Scp complex subunit ScpB [Candidatus Altiarchaeales archaeon]